jgi:hypothetical protein
MNPFLKTLLTQAAGLFGGAIVTAFDHPTGGLASTIASHPEIAIAYVGLSQLLHNWLSHAFPPAPATTTSTAKT